MEYYGTIHLSTGWRTKTYNLISSKKKTNIQTQDQFHRKWYNVKLYGISYEMGQFDVDQTENGFAAPKKVESGRFA